ncbi:MAG TPA: adenylosuccinate lyase [Chitinophagales bacterium]|nr:adenylosuccinate lyase [Chitinophagales bacterium]
MTLSPLTSISPIDGRYRKHAEALDQYFSEFALMRYRIYVEVEYFIALVEQNLIQLKAFDRSKFEALRNVYRKFSEGDANQIKEIEKTTNHDVKAVEYFLREKFQALGCSEFAEFIHFGLTSQDINNTAIPLSFKLALRNELTPALALVIDKLKKLSLEWKDVPMLAHTHGQPASPTLLGKEFYVFVERLILQKDQNVSIPFSAKFGGATGNLNAHYVAYPDVDWVAFGNHFVNEILELNRSQFTTQIEHYDFLAAHFDALKRINTILIDLCRDVWMYISMNYFNQKIKTGEVGSSAMPHKVNPIDFENAEGNLGIANALYEHLSSKLPISRLQRDLTDSTVLRNIGVPVAHSMIALHSILKGLDKLILNEDALKKDLEENWAVVAEAILTILRRESYPDPFNALKDLTRKNEKISATEISSFIDNLKVSDEVKKELKAITPFNYTGRFIL